MQRCPFLFLRPYKLCPSRSPRAPGAEHPTENAARLIADLSLEYGKPVALGIMGPGMTVEQARERADLVPVRAVNAAVNMVTRLGKLQKAVGRETVVIDDTANNN